jgi:Arc/MetJ-type ribon-helix-helix transcriptional regulator
MRRIKVSFEDSEFEELKRLAEGRGSSYSQFIREAVRRMLEQEREREEREREAIERMEALAEEHMLRTVRALEPLRDELGLLKEELRTVEGAVTRLEEMIGLLREELSELWEKVSTAELSAREGGRREGGVVTRKESEADYGQLHKEEAEAIAVGSEAVAADHEADFEIPSFIKDNPWVEILSRKGRS